MGNVKALWGEIDRLAKSLAYGFAYHAAANEILYIA
jgi:hypothetical protein